MTMDRRRFVLAATTTEFAFVGMGYVEFDFVTDNPGRRFLHCHNICHMEAGSAREVRYA